MTQRFFTSSFLFIISLLLFSFSAEAQTTSQALITWRAESYVPSFYQGKVLPTLNSSLNVAVSLIREGNAVDISTTEISWLVNQKIIGSGVGLSSFRFTVPSSLGDRFTLAVRIKEGQVVTQESLTIPVAQPEAVIDIPYPKSTSLGGSFSLLALPYFFPVSRLSELSFSWTVNSKSIDSQNGDPALLVTIPPEATTRSFLTKLYITPVSNQVIQASASQYISFTQ